MLLFSWVIFSLSVYCRLRLLSLGHPPGFPSGFALWKSLGSRGAKPTASENLSNFPRPLRCPSGCALGNSLGSREIWRRGWITQYLPRLGEARIQFPKSRTSLKNTTKEECRRENGHLKDFF